MLLSASPTTLIVDDLRVMFYEEEDLFVRWTHSYSTVSDEPVRYFIQYHQLLTDRDEPAGTVLKFSRSKQKLVRLRSCPSCGRKTGIAAGAAGVGGH